MTCPYEVLPPESFEMIRAYNAWEKGHTPVSTGRAPWLPLPYLQAVEEVGASVAHFNEIERRKARAKRGG